MKTVKAASVTGKLVVLCWAQQTIKCRIKLFQRKNNWSWRKHYLGLFYKCHKSVINPRFHNNKIVSSWKGMEMRTRGAPDLSGNCFRTSGNLGPFVNCWWNRNQGKHTDTDTDSLFLNNTIYFYVFQEILRHGRSFEVEKILSDERYQTLKVSRWKTNSFVYCLHLAALKLLWKWFAFAVS